VAPNRPIDYSPNGAILVPGDEARLRQVLANLLQNANRHTPAGTPVHVRVVDGEHEAVIEVADEGPGMSNEEAGRVFERFWRSDPSRTRSSGGAGLGLSIVAAIADAHGGRAEVQSETGQGSTFRVRLPHVSAMHVAPMDAAPTNVGPAAAPADVHDPGTVPVTDLDDPEPYDR
jgi:two-component system OmpR family sensor kinase